MDGSPSVPPCAPGYAASVTSASRRRHVRVGLAVRSDAGWGEGRHHLSGKETHRALDAFGGQTADVEPGQNIGYAQLGLTAHLGDAPIGRAVHDAIPPGVL